MEYKNITGLKNWDKNNATRILTEKNHEKLKADISRNGIEDAFTIGEDGTVYDGNNRLKILNELINEGKNVSDNGIDLTQVPVIIKNPQTEADKWRIALTNNEQYAQWNQDELSNFLPEFEEELDLSLINIDFFEHMSIDEQLTVDESSNQIETGNKKPQEIQCPNCNHKFTIDK